MSKNIVFFKNAMDLFYQVELLHKSTLKENTFQDETWSLEVQGRSTVGGGSFFS